MSEPCANCGGTGFTYYLVPGATTQDGTLLMRERINPCHVCNAASWKSWAQEVVDHGRAVDGEKMRSANKPNLSAERESIKDVMISPADDDRLDRGNR